MKKHTIRKKMSYEKKKSLVGYGFVSVWTIGFIFFFLKPFIMSFVFSVCKLTIGDGIKYEFIGFRNYVYALREDGAFFKTLITSVLSMLPQVMAIVIFSLFIATMLNQKLKGRLFYRMIFFLPVIIASGIIIGIINSDPLSAQAMKSSSSSNLFQAAAFETLLLDAGFPVAIINSFMGLINNIFALIWQSGVQIILCIAGLQMVSGALYEAAQIEGASSWEIFWKITFPMVSPILMVCLVYSIIDNFTSYTNPLMNMINGTAQRLNFEYSATMSWIYFIVIGFVVGLFYLIVNKKVFYTVD